MKKTILTASLVLTSLFTIAHAQDRLAPDEAQRYAKLTRQDPKALAKAPLTIKADLRHAVALATEEYGGLLIPDARLAQKGFKVFNQKVTPIGELWLYHLTPMKDGWALPENRLNVVSLWADGETAKVPRCVLGVSQPAGQKPVLMVYGKDKNPLLKLPMRPLQKEQANRLDMTAQQVSTEAGEVTIHLLGKYQASFQVTELYLW